MSAEMNEAVKLGECKSGRESKGVRESVRVEEKVSV